MPSILCDAANERINVGTGTTASGQFAVWAWTYRLGAGGGNLGRYWDRAATGGGFQCYHSALASRLETSISRATTSKTWFGPQDNANEWTFTCILYDTSAFTISVYRGTPTSAASLVTPTSEAAGSGSYTTPSSQDLCFGDRLSGSRQFNGYFAACGVLDGAPTLGQIIQVQFGLKNTPKHSGLWLPGENGTGSHLDRSGNGNTATINAASASTLSLPIYPFRSRARRAVIGVGGAPPAGGGSPYYLHYYSRLVNGVMD